MSQPDLSPWTTRQRRSLAVSVILVAAALLVIRLRHPARIPANSPETAPRQSELLRRIDPNTADTETLAAIPTFGLKRAQALVNHREQFLADHPGEIAFRTLEDLTHVKDDQGEHGVKGIGPATLETLRPYLVFPEPGAP